MAKKLSQGILLLEAYQVKLIELLCFHVLIFFFSYAVDTYIISWHFPFLMHFDQLYSEI